MYIDLLLLFLILTMATFGFMKGFVSQIVSLAGLLCIFLFAQPLAEWLKVSSGWGWFQQAPILTLWGMAAFFIFFLFLGILALIHFIKESSDLTPLDRWLGASLGALKGVLIAIALALAFQVLPQTLQSRFGEINADAKQSQFMSVAASMLGWNSLSTFANLKKIQNELTVPSTIDQLRHETGLKHQPWAKQTDVEAD
jgi:uncharacterized membrane protein required for colicin V production